MYKRRELRLHKDGYYDLAKEVIRQWHSDGRPQGDLKGIELWAEMLVSHQANMLDRKAVKSGSVSKTDIKKRRH